MEQPSRGCDCYRQGEDPAELRALSAGGAIIRRELAG